MKQKIINVNFQTGQVQKVSHKPRGSLYVLKQTVKELYRQKNWDGLQKYLLLLDERKMLPRSYRWQIAQCFINQNRHTEALNYLYDLHWSEPLQADIQLTIFDALGKLGKSEFSFQWLKKPTIRAVSFDTIQKCYSIISQSGKSIPLFILFNQIQPENQQFDEFDLICSLRRDSRFHVFNDTCYFRYSRISLKANSLVCAA